MKHRGELLQAAVQLKFRNNTDAARVLGVSRSTLYRYFEQDKLGDDLLLELGEKMGYDFSKDDTSLVKNLITDPMPEYFTKYMEKASLDSVLLTISVDGLETSLERNIEKLKAIHKVMKEQNFAEAS